MVRDKPLHDIIKSPAECGKKEKFMQKVTLTQSTINLAETVKQNKVVYDTTETTHIVASTKSLNILLQELKEKNINVNKVKVADVWCSRAVVNKHLAELAKDTFADEKMQALFIEYMQKQLEKMCIFEK